MANMKQNILNMRPVGSSSQGDSTVSADRRALLRTAGLASLSWTSAGALLAGCGGKEAVEGDAVTSQSNASALGATPAAPAPIAPPAPAPAPAPAPVAPPPPPAVAPQQPLPQPPAAPVPNWAASVAANQWVKLPGTAFMPWARANIASAGYRGTAPLSSIVDAYCDPAFDPGAGAQYFYGGGHGDGDCNAVCKFDHQTLSWSLVGRPTPPSVFLPDYMRTPAALFYPSGRFFAGGATPPRGEGGWFLPAEQLPDVRDAPYRAPQLARVSTHMYAAAAMRGTRVHYFYLTYGEFDVATGTWSGQGVDLGQQLLRFRTQYNSVPLQQGTVAIYDEVKDRFFVTLCPGDNGGGWRSAIMVFDPMTRTIESVHESNSRTYGLVDSSVNVCRVGRDLYVFTRVGFWAQPTVMNGGFIFNMDTLTFRRFVLTGDTAGSTFPFSNTQDAIPSFYDGQAIRRWNYCPEFRNQILSVDLNPQSGTGTPSDPIVLRQTSRIIGGVAPPQVKFVFSRFVYHGGARCAMVIPTADSDWYALKLA